MAGRWVVSRRPGWMRMGRRFFFHSRHWVDQLEAGEPVVASCAQLSAALWDHDRKRDLSAPRPRLPFGRGVRLVRVSPDDRVVPATGD